MSPLTAVQRHSTVRSMTLNLHAGLLARASIQRRGRRSISPLARLLRRHRPDIVVLTEVRDVENVRKAATGYTVSGSMRGHHECILILTRDHTMTVHTTQVAHVSGSRDTMHPTREFPVVGVVHKPSAEAITIVGVHLWSMGQGWKGTPQPVIKEHVNQARSVVSLVEGDKRVLALGDYNEDLDDPTAMIEDRTTPSIFADARLRFTARALHQHQATSLEGKSLLDDVAYRGFDPRARYTLNDPGYGADHRPVVTDHMFA